MVEPPAAAPLARPFAPAVAFFRIGPNAFTQSPLAVARGHDMISHLSPPLSPVSSPPLPLPPPSRVELSGVAASHHPPHQPITTRVRIACPPTNRAEWLCGRR
ncbi:putative PEP-binding protein [Escherichia coli]|uniref:putative PEP-binding protein n=1 Tax=Escherichia coli TaxID=562 RepID=UPI003F4FECAD